MKSEERILSFDKETDNKWRWIDMVEDAAFELYIHKWRTPKPRPEKIKVTVGELEDTFPVTKECKKEDFENNPDLKENPIYAELEILEEHTKTMRYTPIGNDDDWGIGQPYIPFQLLPEKKDRIAIFIEWR